jgi:hypothetical protein
MHIPLGCLNVDPFSRQRILNRFDFTLLRRRIERGRYYWEQFKVIAGFWSWLFCYNQFTKPTPGADQAAYAHTVKSPAPSLA